jgi:hypothetical protein
MMKRMKGALEVAYDGTPARVMGCEYLIAIAVQAGWPKDRGRVEMLMSFPGLNATLLMEILSRYGLKGRWEAWAL